MFKIINYVEVCSNSLLATFDSVNQKYDANGKLYLDLDRSAREILEFHIKSNLKNERHFGYKNIILNTCRPYNNWRQHERGSVIKACKYAFSDETVTADKQKLEHFLDKLWNQFETEFKEFTLLSSSELDLQDLQTAVEKNIGIDCLSVPPYYYILKDSNIEYEHKELLPAHIINEVETKLRRNKLII